MAWTCTFTRWCTPSSLPSCSACSAPGTPASGWYHEYVIYNSSSTSPVVRWRGVRFWRDGKGDTSARAPDGGLIIADAGPVPPALDAGGGAAGADASTSSEAGGGGGAGGGVAGGLDARVDPAVGDPRGSGGAAGGSGGSSGGPGGAPAVPAGQPAPAPASTPRWSCSVGDSFPANGGPPGAGVALVFLFLVGGCRPRSWRAVFSLRASA